MHILRKKSAQTQTCRKYVCICFLPALLIKHKPNHIPTKYMENFRQMPRVVTNFSGFLIPFFLWKFCTQKEKTLAFEGRLTSNELKCTSNMIFCFCFNYSDVSYVSPNTFCLNGLKVNHTQFSNIICENVCMYIYESMCAGLMKGL